MEYERKLSKRGNSWMGTIPDPILWGKDLEEKHVVIFEFDERRKKWFIEIKGA